MSEPDAIDLMIERAAREEQEALDRAQGQHILDAVADQRERQGSAEHPFLEALSRAHKAKADKQ
jgi:hypothetical protein